MTIRELYTDGTKIEANANRYTFIWSKSISTNREKIKEQLNSLWQYAQQVAAAEMDDTDPSTLFLREIRQQQGNRVMEVANNYKRLKEHTKKRLKTPQGVEMGLKALAYNLSAPPSKNKIFTAIKKKPPHSALRRFL